MITPETLRIGDTWNWTATVPDYHAADGWTLRFAFRGFGLSVIDLQAASDGDNFAITVPAVTTATYVKGRYSWEAYIEKGAGAGIERYEVGSGTVELLPFLASATAETDNRTHAEKVLDAIEATLEGRASKAQASITVNGKAVTYMKHDELIRLRNQYRREVADERGTSTARRILTRFGP